MKDHLLGRLVGDGTCAFTNTERQDLVILGNALHVHRVIRLNYTTYDIRRDHDMINPRRNSDIMLLAPQDDSPIHPYLYAQVNAIFHVSVQHFGRLSTDQRRRQIDVCWVRWYALDDTVPSGVKAKRFYQVGFLEDDDPAGYGFVDPSSIVRAVHLIPNYAKGTIIDDNDEETAEYWRYYINSCVSYWYLLLEIPSGLLIVICLCVSSVVELGI